ncbi:vgr related protein [Novosphingobium huizhouense]|uniref:vgr related protein n=1 Tax=Novosphingobium huizhouense TaxID=2866625 RepID=UPI001CD90ABB|nr:vgr related protein [Novosphingobium huizhouense]
MEAERALTTGERALSRRVFGDAIALDQVRLRRRRFFPFQPRNTVMAPMGHIHFHPEGPHWQDDFATASLGAQGLFIHEMVHVWQAQQRGKWWLPLMRHPFCRYDYRPIPGRPFDGYGIEQQAEIVRHWFLAACGAPVPGAPAREVLAELNPFTGRLS